MPAELRLHTPLEVLGGFPYLPTICPSLRQPECRVQFLAGPNGPVQISLCGRGARALTCFPPRRAVAPLVFAPPPRRPPQIRTPPKTPTADIDPTWHTQE